MKAGPQTVRIGYFGKLPSRADFIKVVDNLALAGLLDDWLAGVLNVLSAEPRWKLSYDVMRPLQFAFIGTRSRRAIGGYLAASSDSSQRRYPFLCMSAMDIEQPSRFGPRSPLVLAPLWAALDTLAGDVLDADEPDQALQALSSASIEIDEEDEQHGQALADFFGRHTLTGLEAMLGVASVRRAILAVGLLLLPVHRSGTERLDRSLVLPLPSMPRHRYLVAAFWLDLILPFLQQADVELSLFLGELRGKPSLVLGFGGAAPETLAAIVEPLCAVGQQIHFDDTEWVDEQLASEPQVLKLSAYLEQGQLTLCAVQALFHETFV